MSSIFGLDEHLDSNEKIIYFFRPSRKAYLLQYIFLIALLAISLYFIFYNEPGSHLFIFWKFVNMAATAAFIIIIFFILMLEYRILSRRYALTTKRMLYSKGIFHEVFKSLAYNYVTDIHYAQSFWDKVMNTGTLTINTSGTDDYEIRYRKISHPLEVKKRINNMQSHQLGSQTLHIHKPIIKDHKK